MKEWRLESLTWSEQPREEGQLWEAVGDEVGPDISNDMEICSEVEQEKSRLQNLCTCVKKYIYTLEENALKCK